MRVGVHILPRFPKDTTDRNRTSPFAFTGNKFEFRMLGSTLSISGPNIVLNTIVAEELSQFADILEQADDFNAALHELIKKTFSEHKRIVFNGNNYSDEWVEEAKRRGLLNLKTTVDALPSFISDKNVALFTKHKIFTTAELHSRYEILMESYSKKINIEALTMLDMAKRKILPAVASYIHSLTQSALDKKALCDSIPLDYEMDQIKALSEDVKLAYEQVGKLQRDLSAAQELSDVTEQGVCFKDTVLVDMEQLRATVDKMEEATSEEYWPYPNYTQLLYSVHY